MTVAGSTVPAVHRMSPRLAFTAAVVTPAVVAVALCAVVAAIAHGAGASDDFNALKLPVYTVFVVIGLLAGAIGWTLIRRRATDPAGLLRRLVPTVVVLSVIPDLLVGLTDSLPGTSWGAVVALMVMHLVVAVCGVVAYRLFLPVDGRRPAG